MTRIAYKIMEILFLINTIRNPPPTIKIGIKETNKERI